MGNWPFGGTWQGGGQNEADKQTNIRTLQLFLINFLIGRSSENGRHMPQQGPLLENLYIGLLAYTPKGPRPGPGKKAIKPFDY